MHIRLIEWQNLLEKVVFNAGLGGKGGVRKTGLQKGEKKRERAGNPLFSSTDSCHNLDEP